MLKKGDIVLFTSDAKNLFDLWNVNPKGETKRTYNQT